MSTAVSCEQDVQLDLTRREAEILMLLMEVLSVQAVADTLYVSAETVTFHLNRIRRKLDQVATK